MDKQQEEEEEKSKLQQEYYKVLKEFVQQEQEEELTEEEREKIRKNVNFLIKKGLCNVWAYYCKRCNYLWFPKDFIPFTPNTIEGGRNIFNRKSPTACARCKSKYWNSLPQRKTKHTPDPKKGIYGHDMLTDKRLRAEEREYKRCLAIVEKHEKLIQELAKEFNIELEKELEKAPLPLPLIPNRRRKKKSLT